MMTKKPRKTEFDDWSGTIYRDLGLKVSDELFARSKIGILVFKLLTDRKLKQREIAEILGISQSDVSHLLNGHFSRFTTDKLLDFLRRLNRLAHDLTREYHGPARFQHDASGQR